MLPAVALAVRLALVVMLPKRMLAPVKFTCEPFMVPASTKPVMLTVMLPRFIRPSLVKLPPVTVVLVLLVTLPVLLTLLALRTMRSALMLPELAKLLVALALMLLALMLPMLLMLLPVSVALLVAVDEWFPL